MDKIIKCGVLLNEETFGLSNIIEENLLKNKKPKSYLTDMDKLKQPPPLIKKIK